jgi:hypothetical protein
MGSESFCQKLVVARMLRQQKIVTFFTFSTLCHTLRVTLLRVAFEAHHAVTIFFFFFCVLPVPRRKCVCDRFRFPTV